MKKTVLALMAFLIFAACEYNPYYDGQKMALVDQFSGLIKEDGEHIYIPDVIEGEYVIDIVGGKGKSHTITVSDPDLLDYSYSEEFVKGGFDAEIRPAQITLLPKKTGDTSITVNDDDTGEKMQFNVHIADSYIALADYYGLFGKDYIYLAFKYDGSTDVAKICLGNYNSREMDVIAEAKFKFLDVEGTLCLELTYPSDEDGALSATGTGQTTKLYMILPSHYKYTYYTPEALLESMNFGNFTVQTKAKEPAFNDPIDRNYNVIILDITETGSTDVDEETIMESGINVNISSIFPWIY